VFQGGCAGTDYCDDTAAQANPSYAKMATPGDLNSCPAGDSCPNDPGLDNVFNFVSVYPSYKPNVHGLTLFVTRWITLIVRMSLRLARVAA
jgi:hypothetical protein